MMHNEYIGDEGARRTETQRVSGASDLSATARTLGGLFSELARETSTLVRKEVELAKVEMSEKMGKVGTGVSSVAIGGAVLYAGLLTLIATAVFALALIVDLWLSALIIGVIVSAAGVIIMQAGRRNLTARSLMPRRTLETLRNDRDWAKEQMR